MGYNMLPAIIICQQKRRAGFAVNPMDEREGEDPALFLCPGLDSGPSLNDNLTDKIIRSG